MEIFNEGLVNAELIELAQEYGINKVIITDYVDANNKPRLGYNIFQSNKMKDTVVIAIGSNVKYMRTLFNTCDKYIRKIKFHKFNNSKNIESMEKLFSFLTLDECPNLSDLDLSNLTDMNKLFARSTIKGSVEIKNDTLVKLNTMSNMFNSATIDSIDINIKAPKITYIESVFTHIDVKNSIRFKIREGKPMFMEYILFQAHASEVIDLSGINFSSIIDMSYAFKFVDCPLLNLGMTYPNSGETVTSNFVIDKSNLSDDLTIRCVAEMAKFLE